MSFDTVMEEVAWTEDDVLSVADEEEDVMGVGEGVTEVEEGAKE